MDMFDTDALFDSNALPGRTLFREYYLHKGDVEIRIHVAPNEQGLLGVLYFIADPAYAGELKNLKEQKLPEADKEYLTRGHSEYDALISAPPSDDSAALLRSFGLSASGSRPEKLLMKAHMPVSLNDVGAFERAVNSVIDVKRDGPVNHDYIQSLIARVAQDMEEAMKKPAVAANPESMSASALSCNAAA